MKYYDVPLRPDAPEVKLTVFVPDMPATGDALLVIPGGAYQGVCFDREGDPIALSFMSRGVRCFVLHYSVADKAKFPAPLIDATLAMAYIRQHAEEFGIRDNRVFTVGFSAGGHLAASLGTLWHLPELTAATGVPEGINRPTGMILCYAVISALVPTSRETFWNLLGTREPTQEEKERYSLERRVDERTCPAFFMHTSTDRGVPVENALVMARAMADRQIPFEMHVYPRGTHGVALANRVTYQDNPQWEDPQTARWVEDAFRWMQTI